MSSFASSGDWPENFKQLKTIDDLLRCPICYEYFDITMIIPQCSHNYCSLCIRRYLNYKTQCPTCGVSVSEPELRNNRGIDDLVRQFLDVRPRLLQCVKSGVNNHTTDTTDRQPTSVPVGSKPDASIFQHVSSAKTVKSSKATTTSVKKSPPTNTLDRFCSTAGTRTFPVDDDNGDDFQDNVKRPRNKRISYKESSSDDDVEIVGTVVTPPPVKAVKVPSPQASTSSESTSGVERNSSQVATADCPVCGVSIPERHINTHLDVCLTREEKKESLRSSAPKRKPMAKLVYNLMSDKDLRKRLKEKGLSTQGDRQALIARHHEFVLRYNSQCDSAEPKSEWTYDFAQSELPVRTGCRRYDDHIKDMFDNVKKKLSFVEKSEPLARDACLKRERRWEDYVKEKCPKPGLSAVSEPSSGNNAVVSALLTAQPFWPRICRTWVRTEYLCYGIFMIRV
uniref:RING-type E3 ubiquitin transferase n=2 Tax=Branchiostoma floridae TaxID=7739 RepID=C3YLR5_BRAFL|eukprot:XP_002602822.1 hypothetical protein BRAFLDRAFT_132140 [Branchiostoma floridae]